MKILLILIAVIVLTLSMYGQTRDFDKFVQEEKAHRTEFSFWKLVSKSTDSNLVTLCEQRGHVLRGTVYSEYDEWIKRVVDTPDSALMITWKGYSKNFCLRCRLILKHEFCDTTTIWKR